jgi:hypothetical protein
VAGHAPKASRNCIDHWNFHGVSDTVYVSSHALPPFSWRFLTQYDLQNIMIGLEKDFPFCANPDCQLYVCIGDPGVMGFGNWAQLPDGRIIGRSIHSGVYLCDACGRAWRPVPTFKFASSM